MFLDRPLLDINYPDLTRIGRIYGYYAMRHYECTWEMLCSAASTHVNTG